MLYFAAIYKGMVNTLGTSIWHIVRLIIPKILSIETDGGFIKYSAISSFN